MWVRLWQSRRFLKGALAMAQQHKAVLVKEFNEEAKVEVASVKTPKPEAKQVLVKMLCRPINPSDVLRIQGKNSNGPSNFPFVPGFEGMGTIHELGEGVTGLQVGQRVFYFSMGGSGGSWQEYVSAAPESVFPVPDSVPNEVAAQFLVNPWTAYGMLEELKVPAGEYVLQTGAASVLGRMFIQLAHHKGVKTINLVRRNEQKEELKAIGADVVINFKEEDVVETVKSVTEGKMVFGAIDCVGGQLTKVVCSSVRDGGTVSVYGALDGFEATVEISDILFRGVNLHGFHLSRWIASFQSPDEFPKVEFPKVGTAIMELLAKRIITPLIGEKFPLEEAPKAIQHSQVSSRGGKVLLVSE